MPTMKNKNAGERKRTVTLTVGPITEKLLKEIGDELSNGSELGPWTALEILYAAARRGLRDIASEHSVVLHPQWHSLRR